jgi:hypothetical protein
MQIYLFNCKMQIYFWILACLKTKVHIVLCQFSKLYFLDISTVCCVWLESFVFSHSDSFN